jgi:hypothetical protein
MATSIDPSSTEHTDIDRDRPTGPVYDLVSVLYHALQGAETQETYIQNARSAGDQDLEEFLRDVQQIYQQTAERAKDLLQSRLS